ncbi:DUF348 domain-containing protein [Virgibacillus sp. NKC19-16]|uniref:G5 and 3D domain-containing protein n=1 Tax=Virgibacillus salidurans TaxID=2831673 RepID=UPI001F39EF9D|nr:G5 and 3D domain-containing protein [Virgibacillus sp. NKC19-16]UJL46471.1 DUF348 domain-containing protein [Virgibacillus sp. NKC19-16]
MRIFQKLMPASKMKLVVSSIGVLALIVFSGYLLFEGTKAEVVIVENDEKQTVKTHTNTVEELLQEAGITVGEHDALSHNRDAKLENGMEITYDTAKQIIVTVDGDEQEYYTTADTIEEFLAEHNLSFAARDDISHDNTEAIKDGLHIEVNQAFQVTINDGGEEKKAWTTGGTIEDLLTDADVDYDADSDDEIKPGLGEDVTEDTAVNIVRVEKEKEELTESIAFDTETKEDSSLAKGEERVVTQGEEGKVKKIYEVVMENGEEIDRELVSEEVIEESENRVLAVGTKEQTPDLEPEPVQGEANIVTLSNTSSEPEPEPEPENEPASNSNSGGKSIQMSASAYTASCSGCSGYTTTGVNLNANPNKKVIAVDPGVIPLGTKVWVEGYGEAVASDTGGHITGNRVDVHVPSQDAAYDWGRKTVEVKILD